MAGAISSRCYSSLVLCLHLFCSWGLGEGGRGSLTGPQFGETEDSVFISAGDTARLPCIVHHLSDRSVTWLRRRDLHILTVGHHTYSADDRFEVTHRDGSDEWTLVIRYAQPRDAGIYDCQINTDPKISHPVTLKMLDTSKEVGQTKTKVFVANNTASTSDGDLRVEIKGPRELYIEEGSSLSLTCLVTSLNGPSTLVYWYHNTNLIDYNSPRGGINLKIDRGRGQTTTHLLVSSVGPGDSGMYSCVPTGSHPATVRVHVNQGENEAAIQQGGLDETSSASCLSPPTLLFPLLPCVLLLPPLFFYVVGLQEVSFKSSIGHLKALTTSCFACKFFLFFLAPALPVSPSSPSYSFVCPSKEEYPSPPPSNSSSSSSPFSSSRSSSARVSQTTVPPPPKALLRKGRAWEREQMDQRPRGALPIASCQRKSPRLIRKDLEATRGSLASFGASFAHAGTCRQPL